MTGHEWLLVAGVLAMLAGLLALMCGIVLASHKLFWIGVVLLLAGAATAVWMVQPVVADWYRIPPIAH